MSEKKCLGITFISQCVKKISLSLFVLFVFVCLAQAQTTDFTYQGRLTDNNVQANGSYQMQFALFDAASGGNQIGATVTNSMVQVTNGIFTVNLDFGSNTFPGTNRFLQISVFSSTTNAYVVLNPRQQITSAPYAVKSLNAATAENSNNLGGIPADQYVTTNDARLSDARDPLGGSISYIQNTAVQQQPPANFNISGNGTVGGTISGNIVSATMQFNIGANRVFSVAGTNNVFAGVGAGNMNIGSNNSFFGRFAGASNTSANNNSFFGNSTGDSTTTGGNNSFFGSFSGSDNTAGTDNSFFGTLAGTNNTTGDQNSFFGESAGKANTTGNGNTFIGEAAGLANTTGFLNTFVGRYAGGANTTGNSNVFIGYSAGNGNITGNSNTIIGYGANVGNSNITNSTAIGAGAYVFSSNQVVIGTSATEVSLGALIDGTYAYVCGGPSGFVYKCSAPGYESAFAPLQTKIEQQQNQIQKLQEQIESLRKLLCSQNTQAEICKEEKK